MYVWRKQSANGLLPQSEPIRRYTDKESLGKHELCSLFVRAEIVRMIEWK